MNEPTPPLAPPRVRLDPSDADRAEHRHGLIIDVVREISRLTDPQVVISVFRRCMNQLYGGSHSLSVSRRELSTPWYRITRSTRWTEDINPWNQKERLPLLSGGILGELLYAGEPRMIPDFRPSSDDPAFDHFHDARSLMFMPLFEGGIALNGALRMSPEPDAFDPAELADAVLTANLFGRSTHYLVLARQLQIANQELEREMQRVSELQRRLLPRTLPSIPSLDLAVSYKTARRAGGDYYDFFDMGDGRWGVLIADVSGHGTPAAVVMAMLRTMLHGHSYQRATAAELLSMANQRLAHGPDHDAGTFVTAFYGVFDPRDRSLQYSCAGHHPPLLVNRNIRVCELDGAQSLPLAVDPRIEFPQAATTLDPGDTLLLYTDGITEAVAENGEMYGRERLLSCVREDVPNAQHIIDCVTHKLMAFTGSGVCDDDQTLLAMRVR